MMKKVNVLVNRPIYTVKPAIIRNAMGVYLSTEDIKRCLWGKAFVEEVLPTGEIIPLDLRNFDKVHYVDVAKESDKVSVNVVEPKVEEEKVVVKEEVVVEEPKEGQIEFAGASVSIVTKGQIEDIDNEDIPVEEFESELNKTYEVNGNDIKEVKEDAINVNVVNKDYQTKNKKKRKK